MNIPETIDLIMANVGHDILTILERETDVQQPSPSTSHSDSLAH